MYFFWDFPIAVFLFLAHFATAIVPFFLLTVLGLKKPASALLYSLTRFYGNLLLKSLGVNLHVERNPEAEKLIRSKERICFIGNHTSMLDIPSVIIATYAELGFIVKRSIAYVPVVHLITFAMRCVFINRSNVKDSVKGIRRGEKIIAQGHSMLIFPEGTRSKTGEIATFKHGSFRLASESGSYVIPVTIKGLRQSLEDRKKLFGRYAAFVSVGAPVKMNPTDSRDERFDKIIKIENYIRETYAALGDK